ncbi:MAG: PAS domain S-box protein [Candidatus Krumholzibacteriota bacterium]
MKEDLQPRFRAEQIRQLYSLTPAGLIANVTTSAILTFALWSRIAHPVLIVWLLGVAVAALLRFLLYFLYGRAEVPDEKAAAWGHWFSASVTLSGIAWGLVGIFLFPTDSIAHQVLVAFVMGGMVAGASATLSVLKRVFFLYSVPVMVPVTVRFFILGEDIQLAMGTMILMYSMLMVMASFRAYRIAADSISLRFENLGLIGKLKDEIGVREQAEAEIQKYSDSLETAVQERTSELVAANKELSREMTEREAAEEALRESEERHRTLFEGAAEGILVADIETQGFKYANLAICKMLGYTLEELNGMSISDIHPPESLENVIAEFEAQARGEKTIASGLPCLRKDGTIIYVDISTTSMLMDDRKCNVGFFSDITARKRAEEEKHALERKMQHAQKLESLGVLAGGIAHDFNNLLMAILGNADLALDELPSKSPVRSNIQEIERASKRAAELAKQMLAYSGKGRFVVEPIDAGHLVEEMAHLLAVSISKKTALEFNFAENLPTFDGDMTQIRQVIMNLITNAAEAIGEESGTIVLSTGAMECDRACLGEVYEVLGAGLDEPLPEGTYVYFEVSDTGCGADAETVAKIFDPFFTTKFTGRGLGMSAVLGIVRGHRGGIKIRSEVGEGTTFTVLFPANEQTVKGVAGQKEIKAEGNDWRGSGTVLVVDDEETVCAVAEQMLDRFGFSVLTAFDGREALRVFRENTDEIVCVLLDLTMPFMDGEETFREMRLLHPDVRVILCSGYNEQEAVLRFAGKGLAGFIQKPFSMAALKGKLMAVLKEDR